MKNIYLLILAILFPFYNSAQNLTFGAVVHEGNILYKGVENKVDIFIEGYLCKSVYIKVDTTYLKFRKEGKTYIFIPQKTGGTEIYLYNKADHYKNVGTIFMRIKNLPDPNLKFNRVYLIKSDTITMNARYVHGPREHISPMGTVLYAEPKCCIDVDVRYLIKEYYVDYYKPNEEVEHRQYYGIFTLTSASPGDIAVFRDIRVTGSNGEEYILGPYIVKFTGDE